MKLKRLYIGEMGIYRNALLEDIGSKIVVIGGLNRAGKTTLLEILRHMPYGFPKNLRTEVLEYNVESDLIDEENNNYTIKLSGLKEPRVSLKGENRDLETKQLYGTIDKFTYSQLYTVTLDELKRSNVKNEEEKLQAVLLGAGLKDIAHMPKLSEDFKKDKEKIGGKHGNPTTKSFKPSYDRLIESINKREEALRQLEEYEVKCTQLKETEDDIQITERDIRDINQKLTAMEFLKTYYRSYKDKIEIEFQLESMGDIKYSYFNEEFPSLERIETLKEEYDLSSTQYEKAKESFIENVSHNMKVYEQLKEQSQYIREAQSQVSGLKEKVENFKSLKATYERDREQVLLSMNSLNSSWKGDFVKIINLDCDSLEQDRLMSIIEGIRQEEENKKLEEKELEGLKLQDEVLKKEISRAKPYSSGIFIDKYLYISLGVFLAGAVLFLLNKTFGGALALSGIASGILYWYSSNENKKHGSSYDKEFIIQMNTVESKIRVQESKIKNVQETLDKLDKQLNYFKDKLDIRNNISHIGLIQYLRAVQELKTKIMNLGGAGTKLSKLQAELSSDFSVIYELLSRFFILETPDDKDISKSADRMFARLEALENWLYYGEALASAEGMVKEKEGRLKTLLKISDDVVLYIEADKIINQYKQYNSYKQLKQRAEAIDNQVEQLLSSERISEAVSAMCKCFNIAEKRKTSDFYKLLEHYGSQEEISREYTSASRKFEEASHSLEGLKEKRQDIKNAIGSLSTTDKLEDAQRSIDEARAALKQQAVKYSVYAAAEYIVDSVKKNFIDTAKDTILGGAGTIFNKITGGEYKALLPGDNLLQTDFKAMKEDGELQGSTELLSRGTGEQLFLSVRINRIKDLKPKVPVILDDPFVNFDSIHTMNTLKVISELSEENQIFILTCHSELVELVSSLNQEVQYWKLSKGKFELSDCEKLIKYLI